MLWPQGDIINLTSAIGSGYVLHRQSVGGVSREKIVTVPHRYRSSPAWIHSFACSLHHAVIPETPLYFDLMSLTTGESTDHVFMNWKPEDGVLLHLAPLSESCRVQS